ncbi:MAG TPA: hypothetical protein HPP77_09360 [Candidatus Hydrogenedentes bacterium]|nr:hypothetical protein [Candidatus Hydrogenedentota bacterium]HIJ73568.1 hypothetical protein [Candidatus Hydrogenedentota bacterium]
MVGYFAFMALVIVSLVLWGVVGLRDDGGKGGEGGRADAEVADRESQRKE